MAVEVEKLLVTLEARWGRYQADMNRASAITNSRLAAMEARFAKFSTRLRSSASTAALGVGTALGGLGAYLSVGQLKEYADGWTRVTRALEANEQVFGMRLRSAEQLNQSANEARADLDSFSKLYFRTAAATRDLGLAENEVATATKTVAMALKLGSASAGEQASTMLQLSQALQKGKLDGDEFRAVMENAGVIQELLADKLKVSKGEIVKMAAAGKLQVPQLIGALLEGADKVQRIFMDMPTTIDEALTVLNNKVTEYIGHMDQAYGGTELLVGAISGLASNIDTVADSAIIMGAAFLAAFSPAIIAGAWSLTAAIVASAGTIGVVLGLVAAAAVAYGLWADKIKLTEDGLVSLEDMVNGVTGAAKELFASFTDGSATSITGVNSLIDRVKELSMRTAEAKRIAGFGGSLGKYLDGTLKDAPEPKPLYPGATDDDAKAAKARARFDRTLEQLRGAVRMRELEAKTIGMSAFETERMLTEQELLNQARELGVELTWEDHVAIKQLAEANARAITETQALRDAFEEVKRSSEDTLKGFINDLREGTSASEALGNALNRIADRLIDMAVNDLVENALGGLTGKGGNAQGGAMGGALLSLFGFAKGGIAANGKPLPMFANGGVSRSAAIFGEAGPEAAVPLPDGRRIPVDLRIPNMSKTSVATPTGQQMSVVVAPVFNVANGDQNTMKTLKGEIAREIPRMVETQVLQMLDRNARLSRLGA